MKLLFTSWLDPAGLLVFLDYGRPRAPLGVCRRLISATLFSVGKHGHVAETLASGS